MKNEMIKPSEKNTGQGLSTMKILLIGYCLIILMGTILLALPISTRGGGSTPITDCLFTATSATCVTGLVRFDTYTHWTTFGQLVILFLIQIGGMGFMAMAITVLIFARKKIGLSQRILMQDSISAPQIGGIVSMTKFIVFGTFAVEGLGAILLSGYFIPRLGVMKGIYFSVFHAVSAFCNAGFDLMGGITGEFSSMTGMVGNWYVNIVLMLLIFIGGLGFFVWQDLGKKKFHFKKFNLQSKLVLSVSVILVFLGAVLLFILEYHGEAFEDLTFSQKILASFFQSVSARTAGFNTVDLGAMTESGKLVMIFLMLIGGSTGSTAGGLKTTTFAVLWLSIFATIKRKKNIEAFGRRLDENVIKTASCLFMIYLLVTISTGIVVSSVESIPIITALFETVSAMATVGSSFSLTPVVGMFTKFLIIFLMICGRVGSITVLMAFTSERSESPSKFPLDKVQVG
ncbi:MAG: TrkH family potassium uptake protein [Lachnospiraceae bacterium]